LLGFLNTSLVPNVSNWVERGNRAEIFVVEENTKASTAGLLSTQCQNKTKKKQELEMFICSVFKMAIKEDIEQITWTLNLQVSWKF